MSEAALQDGEQVEKERKSGNGEQVKRSSKAGQARAIEWLENCKLEDEKALS